MKENTTTTLHDFGNLVQLDFADGKRSIAQAVITADGYASSILSALGPETPYVEYTGYVVWRGLVEKSKLHKSVAVAVRHRVKIMANFSTFEVSRI